MVVSTKVGRTLKPVAHFHEKSQVCMLLQAMSKPWPIMSMWMLLISAARCLCACTGTRLLGRHPTVCLCQAEKDELASGPCWGTSKNKGWPMRGDHLPFTVTQSPEAPSHQPCSTRCRGRLSRRRHAPCFLAAVNEHPSGPALPGCTQCEFDYSAEAFAHQYQDSLQVPDCLPGAACGATCCAWQGLQHTQRLGLGNVERLVVHDLDPGIISPPHPVAPSSSR